MATAGKRVTSREELRMVPGLGDWEDGGNYGDREHKEQE